MFNCTQPWVHVVHPLFKRLCSITECNEDSVHIDDCPHTIALKDEYEKNPEKKDENTRLINDLWCNRRAGTVRCPCGEENTPTPKTPGELLSR